MIRDDHSGFSYRIEPAPAWVVPAQERSQVPVERAGMHYRVIDEQLRVDDRGNEDYSHVVRVVDDVAGLSTAAQIELEFDPAYQTLSLHHLDVVRDGVRSTRLNPQRIQLLQRETQLERRMLDGRVTLALNLENVSKGDEIDFAYTVRGSNPIFGKRFVHVTRLGSWRGPVATHQLRLLAPAERVIAQRVGPADVQLSSAVQGGWRETVLRKESLPQISADEGATYGDMMASEVHFSEFSDWAQVARWGVSLFAEAGPQPLLQRKAEQIRAAHAQPAQRLRAALDFVQQDIRYFGTEIGVNSHLPAAPDKVIEQRYGDCKDKTRLLVALLGRLDIAAVPVLVSTAYRRDVDRWLPSPQAFDHVIARAELDGQTLWLDATRQQQSGPAAQRLVSPFERGLALQADTTALSTLPEPWLQQRVLVKDTFRFTRIADEPSLEARITFRGDHAEGWRDALATLNADDLRNALVEPYLKAYPKLRSTAPLRVEQATDDDAVTFVMTFSVPDFWRFPEQRALVGDTVFWAAIQPLALPKLATRRQALGLALPGVYQHDISIVFPEPVYRQPSNSHFDDELGGISLKTSLSASTDRIDLHGETRIGVSRIEASAWPAFSASLAKALPRMGYTVNVPALSPAQMTSLQARARELEAAIRRDTAPAKTRVQADAPFNIFLLSEQIDAGRLPPALLAEALHARGVQHDHLGQAAKGQADFARALALDPGNAEYLNAAAVNALSQGHHDRALGLTAEVLQRMPQDAEALDTRGRSLYLKGELAAASETYAQLLKDPQSLRRGYPLVWWTLSERRRGRPGEAALGTYPPSQWPTEWPRPLMDFISGQRSADALVAAAKQQKNPAESLAEAYFYMAEAYHADGNLPQAREHWKRSVDQGVVEFVEDAAARQRLAATR